MAWYHVTTYSFDPSREVQGPYPSEEVCWEAMKKAAQKEYKIGTEENQYNSFLAISKETAEITLREHFSDRDDDVTTWFMIETPEREEKTPASATTVLDKNGPVYRINLYNRRFVIVEPDPTAAMSELCLVVAKLQKEGNHVTSVVQLTEGKATPRVKIMNTKEYRDAVRRINDN